MSAESINVIPNDDEFLKSVGAHNAKHSYPFTEIWHDRTQHNQRVAIAISTCSLFPVCSVYVELEKTNVELFDATAFFINDYIATSYEDAKAWATTTLDHLKTQEGLFAKQKIWKKKNRLQVKLPPDADEFPDRYLQPGDHVRFHRRWGIGYSHDALYVDFYQVRHIWGRTKKESQAQWAHWSEPVGGRENQALSLVIYPLRIKPQVDVLNTAIQLCQNGYGYGQYYLPNKNCQHFVSLCVTACPCSMDIERRMNQINVFGVFIIILSFF